jgi:phosphoglycerate-specific signal transduction histidine kinase
MGSTSYYTHYSPFDAPPSPASTYNTDFDPDSDIDDELPEVLPIHTTQNNVFNETIKNIVNKDFGFQKHDSKYVSALDTTSHQIRVLLDDIYAKRIDTNKRMNQLRQVATEASQMAQLRETAISIAESAVANVVGNKKSESDIDIIQL